jgi:hypothetical protein
VTTIDTVALYGVTPPSSSLIFPRTVSGPVVVDEQLALEAVPNAPKPVPQSSAYSKVSAGAGSLGLVSQIVN